MQMMAGERAYTKAREKKMTVGAWIEVSAVKLSTAIRVTSSNENEDTQPATALAYVRDQRGSCATSRQSAMLQQHHRSERVLATQPTLTKSTHCASSSAARVRLPGAVAAGIIAISAKETGIVPCQISKPAGQRKGWAVVEEGVGGERWGPFVAPVHPR